MNIIERVDQELKEAMKAKDEAKLSVMRLMRTAIKNKQIDVGHELSDEEAQAVVRGMVKQGKDALVDFTAGGRQDLVDKQNIELGILETFLPAAMPAEELEALCRQAVEQSGAKEIKDMGKAMGVAMKLVAGRADGNAVKEVIQKLLSTK